MATRSDAVVFLNWYSFLKDVADKAGIAIPAGISSRMAQARGYFEIGRYETAYSMASAAVRDFRTLLKGKRVELRARCDALISSITATLNDARAEGIEVYAFTTPFNGAMSMYDGDDFIAAFHALSGLAEDLSNYVSSARMGRYVTPLSGAYNIPDGTTDIVTLTDFQVESAGWAYTPTEEIREALLPVVREAGGEDILEVRRVGPRIIVFIKGSPIFWIIPVLVAMVIFAVGTWIFSQTILIPWKREEEQGKLARHKADLIDSYNKYIADKVAAGDLSPEVGQQLTGEYADNMSTVKLPGPGRGLWDYVMFGVGIVVVGTALYFTIPMIRGALAKKG